MYPRIVTTKDAPHPTAAQPWKHTTDQEKATMDIRPADSPVRASDHDRDTTVQHLGDALAEGTLDTAEYNRRLEHALAATTHGDLHRLTADLPVSQAARDRAETARRTARDQADKRAWRDEWSYWTGGAAIMTAIWAISSLQAGEWKHYWPAIPLAIWAVILISYAVWPTRDDD